MDTLKRDAFSRKQKCLIAFVIALFVVGELLLVKGGSDPVLRSGLLRGYQEYCKYFVFSFVNLVPLATLIFYMSFDTAKTGIPWTHILVFSIFTTWLYSVGVETYIWMNCSSFDYSTLSFYYPHCVDMAVSHPMMAASPNPSQYFLFSYFGIVLQSLFCVGVLGLMNMIDSMYTSYNSIKPS